MPASARLFTVAFFVAAVQALPAKAGCMVGSVTTLPLTVDGSRLYVPVSLNETPGLFLVDTGSEDTILTAEFGARSHVRIDPDTAQRIISGVGGRGTLPINMTKARRTDIGNLNFPDWEFMVLPPEAGGLGKTEHDGILGMDFLHYFDIEVDLQGGKVILWRVTGCKDIHPEWTGDYDAIPLKHTAHRNVTLPIFVDNAFFDVELDTGSPGLLLTNDAGHRAGATDAMLARDRDPQGIGLGGRFPSVVHHFKLLLVGKGEFDNPAILVETEAHRTAYADGIMGWRFLKARRFWISYATNTLFVQQAAR